MVLRKQYTYLTPFENLPNRKEKYPILLQPHLLLQTFWDGIFVYHNVDGFVAYKGFGSIKEPIIKVAFGSP